MDTLHRVLTWAFLICLVYSARALAENPWPITVQVEDVAAKRTEKIGEVSAQGTVAALREAPLPDMQASLHAGSDHGACKMTATLKDLSGNDREVAVQFVLPASHGFTRALCPDGQDPRDCHVNWGVTYHGSLVLPLVSLYTPGASGLTLCADFDQLLPALAFRNSIEKGKERVEAVFPNLRLPANGAIEVSLYAIPHEGDWRPGLGWALERFPEYFRPEGKRVYEFEGGMIYDFISPEERIVRDKELDLQWQEVGWSWPHLGLYVPDNDTWQHQSSKDGGYGAGGPVSRQMLHDYLALLSKHHVGSFMYFQSTESWKEYAERNFPESMVRTAEGKECPTWVKCVVMNPRPDGPFGKHILSQVDAMLRVFPEIDGLFWDQNCYGGYDFAQQDDLAMVNGRRACSMEIAQRRMLSIAGPRLHAADKAIWSNGPCSVGVARHIDGAMSEGTGGARRMSWLCLAKPLIILSYDSGPAANEEKLMAALECGGQPAVTLGKKECREVEARYQDMLKLMLHREMVLTPYAYGPPAGFRGNIFRRQDGNLIVTLVREPVANTPLMVDLTVRPPKDVNVRAVYELNPDAKGLLQRQFTSNDGVLRWTTVSPRAASMFLLAVRGRFLSTTQRALLPNSQAEVKARLENFTDAPWSADILQGDAQKQVPVPPLRAVDVVHPVSAQPEGAVVRVSLADSTRDLVSPQAVEIPVLPAVGLWLLPGQPDEFSGSAASVTFGMLNRTATELDPVVTAAVEGGEAEAAAPRLPPGQAGKLVVTALKLGVGPHKITVTASAQGTESRIDRVIHITRDNFPSVETLRTARSLTVTMDIFNSLSGQWADKPVSVNGLEVGKLPVTGTTLRWHEGMSLTVKDAPLREIVAKALKPGDASASFRVSIANAVENCFKVRQCRLSFGLADGTKLTSAPKPFVRCSDANWLYTEGESVRLGQPVEAGGFRFAIGATGEERQ